MARYYCNRRKR